MLELHLIIAQMCGLSVVIRYFYGLLGKYLGDNGNNVDPFHEHWVNSFSKEEKIKIKQQVDKYIKENNIKPNKNYSEFSEEFFGIY